MKRQIMLLTSYLPFLLASALQVSCGENPSMITSYDVPQPPVAKKVPRLLNKHGHTRVDNYYWLRDDQRSDPDVLGYLNAENEYTKKILQPIEDLKSELYQEIVGRMQKDDTGVPVKDNGYWYSYRYSGDDEYPIYWRRKDDSHSSEQILLNVNELAKDHDYFSVANLAVSDDNKILAYAYDNVSRRQYKIAFKDLTSGQLLVDSLTNVDSDIVWTSDSRSILYIKKHPQTLLGYQVFKHYLGQKQTEDQLIYEEIDESFYTGLSRSKDRSLIYIHHDSTSTKGVSIADADQPHDLSPFFELEEAHEYSISKLDNTFYILTNWEAINFRVMKVDASQTKNKLDWVEVVPHRDDTLIESLELFKGYLALKERRMGQNFLSLINLSTGKRRQLEFDESVYVVEFDDNTDFSEEYLRIYYSSPVTPGSIYDIDLKTLEKVLRKRDNVLGDFDAGNYKTERLFIQSRDKKDIPVTLMYRKDSFKKNNGNPMHQYGYGAYGITIDPYFRSHALSLADRGFVLATAHVRGSEMLGRDWYFDGRQERKTNSFHDFIDVTKGLTDLGYADPSKIFAAGGSAGGLLMAAVANIAPELYLGIASHVPFVDVVTTMNDPSVPLTSNEYDEWGNPDDERDYYTMLAYSPYDQIREVSYPNMLVTTGLHDSQVQYFEPAKWVAKLRAVKKDNNILVLDTDMAVGHGGNSGRFRRHETRALEYAFFLGLAK